jgi:hypothetical protein
VGTSGTSRHGEEPFAPIRGLSEGRVKQAYSRSNSELHASRRVSEKPWLRAIPLARVIWYPKAWG